jgi:excisionase family DNA binding protein
MIAAAPRKLRAPCERGLIFTDTVPALLDGSKTQTRRLVKLPDDVGEVYVDPGGTDVFGPGPYIKAYPRDHRQPMHPRIRCPYGYPGDRFYVKERWDYVGAAEYVYERDLGGVLYEAGYELSRGERRWRNPMFMPRRAARLRYELTDVRVQRVQGITEEDAQAEIGDARPDARGRHDPVRRVHPPPARVHHGDVPRADRLARGRAARGRDDAGRGRRARAARGARGDRRRLRARARGVAGEQEAMGVTANLEEALRPLVAKLVAEELERRAAAPAAPAADEYLTAAAAGAVASVAPGTIRRWVAEGRLAGHGTARALRIRRADLDAFLTSARRRSRVAAVDLSPEARAKRRLGM